MVTKKQKDKLTDLAIEAMEKAYAPYSNYKIGAAVLASSGKYYTGCNIENAAYTPTIHAEMNAIYTAVAQGEREFVALAVVTKNNKPPFPCALCRQTMAEFNQGDLEIIAANPKGVIRESTLKDLYPEFFGSLQLKKE